MTKIISFSLYGSNNKYLIGLIRNIELAKQYYPDWKISVFYKNLSKEYINSIEKYVILHNMESFPWCGMFMRFFIHDEPNVERFIIRDADSRINQREVDAVNEWLKTDKILHLMRDHPLEKSKVMGGMWGMVPQKDFSMTKEILLYMQVKKRQNMTKYVDEHFLSEIIYKKYSNSSIVHASYNKFEEWAVDFPSDLVDKKFVGEIYNEYDVRDGQHKKL